MARDPKMDDSTGQPKDDAARRQMDKAHGRYTASDAKEGRADRLPAGHAPGQQPKPAEKQ